MVKIGFNCQLPLSEIGLTTDSEGTGVTSLFHSRVLMRFHAPLRPRKMDKFLFLGTHTRFVTTKRIMVTLPLTTSFMNFIVIEIHVLPRQNLELAILLPSRQRFTSVERMIHSIRIDMRVQLHCIARICVVYLKMINHLASLIVQSSSRRAPLLLGPQRQNVGLVPTVHHGRRDSLSRDH